MLRTISTLILFAFVVSCGTSDNSGQTDNAGDTESKLEDAATQAAENEVLYVTMPESTAITVTLVDSIDTDVHVTGANFQARLASPIVVDGRTVFAMGAPATGVLNKVVESGRLKTPAEVHFSLTQIQGQDGDWIGVSTYTIMRKKDSHTKREVAMIGGGAIAGGIIGKIIDKKGSTEIGAAAGAAAGTGLSALTGKQDIYYGPGTEITFFSNQPKQIALNQN